ncbi:unnamed protein product, partial [Heterosigma akashiwo]
SGGGLGDELLEVAAGDLDVEPRGVRAHGRVALHHHHVRVLRQRVHVGREPRVAHLHAPEAGVRLAAAELELLDDVGDLLEAVRVVVLLGGGVADDQEGGRLEEHHLVRAAHLAEVAQVPLQQGHVGDQAVHDAAPGLVQRLVPDGGGEAGQPGGEVPAAARDQPAPAVEDRVPLLLGHQVHLVHQDEHLGVRRVLLHRLQHALVVREVLLQLGALDVEHVDEHLHAAEDQVPLGVEVGLVEGVLAAAVPQVQHQPAEEAHVRVLHVEGGRQPHRVPCQVVREDDTPHRGLSRPRLPHQDDFLFCHSPSSSNERDRLSEPEFF